MKMVGRGKLKRESMTDNASQAADEAPVQEEVVEEVKPREPLSGKKTMDGVVVEDVEDVEDVELAFLVEPETKGS